MNDNMDNNEHVSTKIDLKSEEFQEILGSVPSWILRRSITLITLFVAIIITGSAIFRYPDVITTSMTLSGAMPPTALMANASGKLQELYVLDKYNTEKGEYLAVIENSANTEDVKLLKQYISVIEQNTDSVYRLPSKKFELGPMQIAYSNFYVALSEYYQFLVLDYYLEKIHYMEKRIKQQDKFLRNIIVQREIVIKQLDICEQSYKRDSILQQENLMSLENLELSKNSYLQRCLSLEDINSVIQTTEMQITQLQENLLDVNYQYLDRKNMLTTQLRTRISQLMAEIHAWELTYVLIAPINGKIAFTKYWIKNQGITLGEVIFNVIPTDSGKILGYAQMPLYGSGKVKVGQKVNIRFTNFPDNEYGIVKGVVEKVSTVPVKATQGYDYYVVEIGLFNSLKTTYNKELPYLPGMQAQADIITEDISLLERFFMPLRKMWSEGMQR